MRIISGKYKGKDIHPGKLFTARPTTDFAKESLFNILANSYDFEDLEVLDLFAGTGGISYEFASRDARLVETVELKHQHATFIQKTCAALDFKQIKLFKMDAFKFLKSCTRSYDIIFADPPYDMEGIDTLPEIIFEKKLLKDSGTFILEHAKSKSFANHGRLEDHRNYGNVNFSFFKNAENPEK